MVISYQYAFITFPSWSKSLETVHNNIPFKASFWCEITNEKDSTPGITSSQKTYLTNVILNTIEAEYGTHGTCLASYNVCSYSNLPQIPSSAVYLVMDER